VFLKILKKLSIFFLKSANNGLCIAQYQVATCYESGTGCTKDQAKAVEMFMKAAVQNNYISIFKMGFFFYENGISVTQSLEEAEKWYAAAVKFGVKDAQQALDDLQLKKKGSSSSSEGKVVLKCAVCEEQVATKKCLECNKSFCLECLGFNHKSEAKKKHSTKFIDINNNQSNSSITTTTTTTEEKKDDIKNKSSSDLKKKLEEESKKKKEDEEKKEER